MARRHSRALARDSKGRWKRRKRGSRSRRRDGYHRYRARDAKGRFLKRRGNPTGAPFSGSFYRPRLALYGRKTKTFVSKRSLAGLVRANRSRRRRRHR